MVSAMQSHKQTVRDWARKHEALQQRGHFPWEGRAGPSTLQGHPAVGRAGQLCQGLQGQRAASPGVLQDQSMKVKSSSQPGASAGSQEGVSAALQGSQ